VGVHDEAGPRHGEGQAEGRQHGSGAHARARGLASQGRGVAVPCAGHRYPGPAARRGGDRATAVAGRRRRVGAPAQKWHQGPEGGVVLWLATVGSSAALGSRRQQRGREEDTAATVLTGGADGESGRRGGEAEQVGRCRAG
jgi:hypothetical protein